MVINMKYYAVRSPAGNQIFHSWEECREFIKNKKGFSYKSFLSLSEAEAFLEEKELEITHHLPTAYIDGSYDKTTGAYSFGGVLLVEGKEYHFFKKYDADEFSIYRNVAGEIKGSGYILSYAIKFGIKEMNIIYDYIGIEKWYNGKWKANSKIAQAYVDYVEKIRSKIVIHFIKVKSHSNNKYNDKADELAKKALGIK